MNSNDKKRQYQKQWRKKNNTHIKLYLLKTKIKRSAQNKKWRLKNKTYLQNYNIKHKERHKKSNIMWIKKHKAHFNEYHRIYKINKEKLDKEFKLINRLRTRFYLACKSKNIKKNYKVNKYLGCSIYKFLLYIEFKFQPGMTWDNYGKWHIDHIKPCSSFDLSKPSEQLKCFNYKNLQPLWAHENLIKGDKY